MQEDLATSFQETVVGILVKKTVKALKEYNVKQLLLAGGVSANRGLKEKLHKKNTNPNLEICIPSIKYCTDNATMIACAGYYQYMMNQESAKLDMNADSSMDL